MRSKLLFRVLAVVGAAGVVLADGAAIHFLVARLLDDNPFHPTDAKVVLTVVSIIAATVTLAVGLGVALYVIARSYRDEPGAWPRLKAALSSRAFVGAAVAIAIFFWAFAGWWAAYLVDRGSRGFPSPSAFNFDLVLTLPICVLIPVAAGWVFYTAMNLALPAMSVEGHHATRLLGYVLMTFGVMWAAFAGACTVTGGFSTRHLFSYRWAQELQFIFFGALIMAYGAVFLVAGWRLRSLHMRRGP